MSKLEFDGLGVHLKVRDINVSRIFYEEILGLKPIFGYGDRDFRLSLPSDIPSIIKDGLPGAPEKYRGVTYDIGKGTPFEIADGHIAVPRKDVFEEPITSPKVSAMIRVASLLPLFLAGKVRPTYPVRHYYWGTVEAVLRDPDGLVLVLIAPHSDHEVEELSKYVPVEKIDG